MAKELLITEDEAKKKLDEAKNRITPKTTGRPLQEAVKDIATKEPVKEAEKSLSKEAKAVKKAQDERDAIVRKIEEEKKKLEEAKKKNDEKAAKKSQKRIDSLKKDLEKANKKLKQAQEKKRKAEGKKDLKQTAKEDNKNRKEREKNGMTEKDPNKAKTDEKDNTNSKDKDTEKAKLASRIKVNANIQEHAHKYVIVTKDKNGQEHETDVTDAMNQIDNYNKRVDQRNASIPMQGANVKDTAEPNQIGTPKDQGLSTNEVNGRVQIAGTPVAEPTISPKEMQDATAIVNKTNPELKPDDAKLVAETALELSKKDILNDPEKVIAALKKKEQESQREKEEREKEKERARQNARSAVPQQLSR